MSCMEGTFLAQGVVPDNAPDSALSDIPPRRDSFQPQRHILRKERTA